MKNVSFLAKMIHDLVNKLQLEAFVLSINAKGWLSFKRVLRGYSIQLWLF